MFTVKQQSIVSTIVGHRFKQIVTPVSTNCVDNYDDAVKLVYATFADNDASKHYATISHNGRFVRSVPLGFDGFKRPGTLTSGELMGGSAAEVDQ